MKKEWVLDQEAFDRLLAFLHADREQAARKYETIRRRLIQVFSSRHCDDPEYLADETINRVTMKVGEIGESYTGDPALYFYAVAKKIYLEYANRKPAFATPLDTVPAQHIGLVTRETMDNEDEAERAYTCMLKCLNELTQQSRGLVVRYYQPGDQSNRVNRDELARQAGLTANALRIRAHRIRTALRLCVELCLQQQASA